VISTSRKLALSVLGDSDPSNERGVQELSVSRTERGLQLTFEPDFRGSKPFGNSSEHLAPSQLSTEWEQGPSERTCPALISMIKPSTSAQLRDLSAYVIVDQDIDYTTVGGRFSPTIKIDLTSEDVILSVVGAKSCRLRVPAASFRKTGLDGHVAHVGCGSVKTDILLQPFSGGDWAYSAAIDGFVAESTCVTVSLTIGSQAGSATVNVYAF